LGERGDSLHVTFSGLDGCGKSTQIARLSAWLELRGRRPVEFWSRGGYTEGMLLLKRVARRLGGRRVPSPGSSKRDQALARPWVAHVWLTLALLDLCRVYGLQLRWWRFRGRAVLCDRYLWDTLVDFNMLFPGITVEKKWLWKFLETIALKPDLAVLFELSPEASDERSIEKRDPWPEPLEARRRRRIFYDKLVSEGRFRAFDATRSVDELEQAIRALLPGAG